MTQTVVEWLITLYQQTNKIDMFDLEVAKEMEKEQSKRDYYAGLEGYIVKDGGFEGYYNETYNK